MAASIFLDQDLDRAAAYQALYPQVEALLAGETNAVARLANFAAALKEAFGFFWVGFYLVDGDELVLGPFQGPVACSRIAFGQGVCGTAWRDQQTIIVDDVEQFPGHIACSSLSRSEIVVPVRYPDGSIAGVLDLDSTALAAFNADDQAGLERLVTLLFPAS